MSFPRYEAYKDSGVEWLGEVPEHWVKKRLKYVSPFITVGIVVNPSSYTAQEGLPYLYGGEIREGYIEVDKARKISTSDSKKNSKTILEVNDIVTVRVGYPGVSAVVSSECAGGNCASVMLTKHGDFNSQWLCFLMNSQLIRRQVEIVQYGAAQKQFNIADAIEFWLFEPPKIEQAQIARFLDHETARIDALIAEQEQLIELLKEKRQAVISHAVTKGLDPTVPMRDSGVEWLGEVPEHWVIKSYRYSSEIYRGKFGHRPRNDPSLYDGDFAFIQTGDIARAEKYIETHKQTLNEKGAEVSQKFPAGTLVMAIAANIGDTAILGFEAYAPDSVVGFKPNEDIEIEFLRFSLMAAIQELHKTSTQSTQANLNIERIGSVRSVFPPLTEQQQIVKYLNYELEKYAELQHQAIRTIELMQERRSALISAAVTGKIDVRAWKAPASAIPVVTLEVTNG